MPWVLSSLRTCGVGWAPLLSHSRIRSSLRTIVEGSVCGLYWPTVSMKRPSRGERWSATTTRQIGSFLPPTRVSLSRTAMRSFRASKRRRRLAGLPHERPEVRHLAAPDLAHQLAHLVELLDELVDLLDARPRALGDAKPARALDELGPPALLGRHRQDDRLDAVDLAFVDLHLRQLLARQAGQHAEDRLERAHLAQRLELLEEVVERELVAAQLALELEGLVLLELLLGLLDERHDIAHAEDPLRHPLRVEALELVELLPHAGEQDRLARDRLDAERRAAARVAVELRHHDPVELDGGRELLRDVHRVLAGHRVDDEQDVVRPDRLADVDELAHERLVDVQAAGGVDDEDVLALLLGPIERPARDVDRVRVGALLVDVGADLRADLHELVDRGGAVDVARRQRHRRVVLGLEEAGELGGRGRLAGALQAGHEDDRRRPRRERDAHRRAAHERRELLVDDLDDLLAGVELADDLGPQAALLDGRRELLDDLEVHVGLEQRETDLAHGLVDVVLGQRPVGADVGERLLKLLGQGVEHWIASVRRGVRRAAPEASVPCVTPVVRIATPMDWGALPGGGAPAARELPDATPARPMRTYTATATSTARPEAVLNVLTDPHAVARWAPVDFYVDELTHPRLSRGSRARVSGRLAGQEIGFQVEVHHADAGGLSLSADGPVALDVAYELREADAGSEVSASIAVLPRRGLRARLLAEATAAVLAGGALQYALGRIAAEAAAA